MKSKKIYKLLFGVLIYSLCIIGTTYAYLYASTEKTNSIVGIFSSADVNLSVEKIVPNTDLTLVPLMDDALSNAINGVGGNSSCVDEINNLSCEIYKITVKNTGTANLRASISITLASKDLENANYNNLKWRELSDLKTIKENSVINSMSTTNLDKNFFLASGGTNTYYIAVWISENDVDQKNTDYGEYIGVVKLFSDNGSGLTATFGGAPYSLNNYVGALYNEVPDITTINIGGDVSNPKVYLNTEKQILLDNNGVYRYYGKSPNNYVRFNDELWRIISISNEKKGEDDILSETRVKIIRDEVIGIYAYDSSPSSINTGYGVNDWSKADLMTELNTLYFNSLSGTCTVNANNQSETCDFTEIGLSEEARNMVEETVYYLGGATNASGLYADDYYNFERSSSVYDCSINDGACPRKTTWTGKIGLMYPSDFAYATDLSKCIKTGYYYNNEDCAKNNWLVDENYNLLTISPNSDNPFPIFGITNTGQINFLYLNDAVKPVLYLKPNSLIISGSGTVDDPYIFL